MCVFACFVLSQRAVVLPFPLLVHDSTTNCHNLAAHTLASLDLTRPLSLSPHTHTRALLYTCGSWLLLENHNHQTSSLFERLLSRDVPFQRNNFPPNCVVVLGVCRWVLVDGGVVEASCARVLCAWVDSDYCVYVIHCASMLLRVNVAAVAAVLRWLEWVVPG